ncbi:hypothetical protein CHS0354_023262 [Potamilus streckersoni]|uniref:Major facilitator superfamily associated domain-containing protein n=1 Tax=Potamilus streckersoni TaxID=2493646 RepID=A0AAE0S387_9BIVA|nr:hypothetical protein CHS0354_023262 [Potamilus streckersoni]
MESFQSKGAKRDIIDSMLTHINKDLLICKLFYFFFFAAFGSLYPLLAVYFKQLGMNATQSGILIGFRPFIEFCSAPFWGGIADRWKKWKQLMLFSVFCWIAFTLGMAFVKPPAEACVGSFNVTDTDIIRGDLIKPAYSTVFYKWEAVKDTFFALLLIIVIGEFFSAPAITFADSVTLHYLGEDSNNYGRQRMFGSLGWGLSMFFVGMALDHSTTFPEHPCKDQHHSEKNYIVCFAVFSVLMSCAFITATQFRFPFQPNGLERNLPQIVEAVKDKVKEKITGKKEVDREKLVEEDDDMDEYDVSEKNENIEKGQQDIPRPAGKNDTEKPLEGDRGLHISLESKNDMVSDVINSPGAVAAAAGETQEMGEEAFMGRWLAVIKIFATIKYVSVLFVSWFMGFGIGLIFTFLFWYLQDLGGSPTLFGVASVINHMSELLAYFLCSRIITSIGHINVLYAGLAGNVVRFMYISWLKNPWWVLPFECVQGLTHAAVWATTCSYVNQAVPIGLRSSAQGILQGLHHGLGRGCGAVFGGILVNSFGSEVTFRSYGIACIFVLVAFIGSNYFLKRQGIPVDNPIPHEMLEEDGYHLDPHGVPSGLVHNLSSGKLNKQGEAVTSYGSTLVTPKLNGQPEPTSEQKELTGNSDQYQGSTDSFRRRTEKLTGQYEQPTGHKERTNGQHDILNGQYEKSSGHSERTGDQFDRSGSQNERASGRTDQVGTHQHRGGSHRDKSSSHPDRTEDRHDRSSHRYSVQDERAGFRHREGARKHRRRSTDEKLKEAFGLDKRQSLDYGYESPDPVTFDQLPDLSQRTNRSSKHRQQEQIQKASSRHSQNQQEFDGEQLFKPY